MSESRSTALEMDHNLPPQVGREIDQRDFDASANQPVEEMGIDPARLFAQAMEQTRMALCITDPHSPDRPIVFANQAFVELTGYDREEIIGHNCRFLQGRDTSPKALEDIRKLIRGEEVGVVEILNYRKDGTPFWNALHIGPIFDAEGKLTHHYGSQWDITELVSQRDEALQQARVASELQHRTGNIFAAIKGILRLSARGATDAAALAETVDSRIDALALAHKLSIANDEGDDRRADLHTLTEAILRPYRTGCDGRVFIGGPSVRLPETAITPIGLTLHELATNALKYGALCEEEGRVRVEWQVADDKLVIDWVETRGVGKATSEPDRKGTGSRIIDGIIPGAGGTVERTWAESGLSVAISVPLESADRTPD